VGIYYWILKNEKIMFSRNFTYFLCNKYYNTNVPQSLTPHFSVDWSTMIEVGFSFAWAPLKLGAFSANLRVVRRRCASCTYLSMLWAEGNFIGFGLDLFSVCHHSTDSVGLDIHWWSQSVEFKNHLCLHTYITCVFYWVAHLSTTMNDVFHICRVNTQTCLP